MKTQWSIASIRRKWSAWSTISPAVRLRPNFIDPVAQKVQVSGQPGLRGDADRAPAVAVAHEDGLDRATVGRVEERLDGPVLRAAPRLESVERRVGNLRLEPVAKRRREVRHLGVAGGSARRPLPHLAGAVGGLAPFVEGAFEQRYVHGSSVGPRTAEIVTQRRKAPSATLIGAASRAGGGRARPTSGSARGRAVPRAGRSRGSGAREAEARLEKRRRSVPARAPISATRSGEPIEVIAAASSESVIETPSKPATRRSSCEAIGSREARGPAPVERGVDGVRQHHDVALFLGERTERPLVLDLEASLARRRSSARRRRCSASARPKPGKCFAVAATPWRSSARANGSAVFDDPGRGARRIRGPSPRCCRPARPGRARGRGRR